MRFSNYIVAAATAFFILLAQLTLDSLLNCPLARAELGALAEQSEQARPSSAGSAFSIQEKKDAGTTIREYFNSAGVIFGIAWSGHHHPDFRKILGQYGSEFDSAAKKENSRRLAHRGGRSRRIQSENLIVEFSGHLRKMTGRAYVPSLLPSGVNADAIQ